MVEIKLIEKSKNTTFLKVNNKSVVIFDNKILNVKENLTAAEEKSMSQFINSNLHLQSSING